MTLRRYLISLVLLDLPILLFLVWYHFSGHSVVDGYNGINSWRMEHPWSFVPSVVLTVYYIYSWRKRRRLTSERKADILQP